MLIHARGTQDGMTISCLWASTFLSCWYNFSVFDLKPNSVLLTCVNEDSIHIDFGTEGAQDKSTGWSKYQHRKQDPYKEREKTRLVLGSGYSLQVVLLVSCKMVSPYWCQIDRDSLCVDCSRQKSTLNVFCFSISLQENEQMEVWQCWRISIELRRQCGHMPCFGRLAAPKDVLLNCTR